MISCFDYTYVFLCIAFALVRLGHRVCHLLFLNGLPEARFEKHAIRLTGYGLCHDGNTNPDPTALKVSKLEKLFKKSEGVKSISDIEDGYTDSAVTLLDRFKMSHIDCFDGSRDPMVHLRLFSDSLRPMGLFRLQKLSLFGRTLSGVAAIWYAKLEDSVKRNWKEMAEAFVAQYSYNTQIEITTRDLEMTRQEPKESFFDFVTRWRAKASMMTIRPPDKDQIQMVVRNLQPKLMQKMIVLPLPTFADLHEIGVQIEDALKQGLINNDRGEQPRRTFNRSTNAGTSSAAAARASDVSMVTPPPPQEPLQLHHSPVRPEGHLKPLEPQPLPETLPPSHNLAKYCAFHQQHGHDTDHCFRLRHEIQDLVDNRVIMPPKKPNVTTNPLPPHNQAPHPKRINSIQTGVVSYDPSIYITPSHLPTLEVFIPNSTDLCMLDISRTQPDPMVVIIEGRIGMTSEESGTVDSRSEEFGSFAEEVYNPSGYITSAGQRLDDLTDLEEDIANLQFFNKQSPGDMTVNRFDFDGSMEATGWIDDQPDIVEESQPEQGPSGTRTSAVARRARNQNASPKSAGAKNFARDLGILNTGDVEKQVALKHFEWEGIEDFERARKAKTPVGTERAVCTRTEQAMSTWTEGAVSTGIVVTEPDRCLSAADGMWWEDDDLCLAHTDEDWGNN
ncbi:hypothetical protein HYC85_027819 [Camellia sinensis]|uniref:Retrotransposon gag domain-containing protein n=1 Tax=Camellia sinensis TaxID=4442 RepID=A0A7J7FVF2_CAMSI|nr:hypothetical protein HYC85_027819 [Camellia sinensis]